MALFADGGPVAGTLVQACYVDGDPSAQRAEAWLGMVEGVRQLVGGRLVNQLVVELPQVYVAVRSKGDPNDLIALAAVVGGLCEAFRGARQRIYLPREWKGQAPKEVIAERALKRLTPDEAARVTCRRKSLLHNVLDATALGLVALGRM